MSSTALTCVWLPSKLSVGVTVTCNKLVSTEEGKLGLAFFRTSTNSVHCSALKKNIHSIYRKHLLTVTTVARIGDKLSDVSGVNLKKQKSSLMKGSNSSPKKMGEREREGVVAMSGSQNGSFHRFLEKENLEGEKIKSTLTKNDEFTFAVLGDLHLEPSQMDLFSLARSQVVKELKDPDGNLLNQARIVQLGDVGGYAYKPGSRACFQTAVEFLNGFELPRLSVLGNHDLEGYEFETDAENLTAWQEEFGQSHFWELDVGSAVCLGLSTVRFRTAVDCCHEVFIDEEQVEWFLSALARNADRPVFVFTHAPPIGSGLTSLQEVHVRNRCAWLNHSEGPQKFLDIVHKNPQIKLWFSGHFHLSHDYEGSISRVGNCLFVQTGVMGECNRDGRRHSRILKGNGNGYRLYTLDHGTGSLRLDVLHSYDHEGDGFSPQRLWCSNLSLLTSCPGGGAFSPRMPSDVTLDPNQTPPDIPSSVQWWHIGETVIAFNSNQLIEYDASTRAPIGIICEGVNGREIRLIEDKDGVLNAIELYPTSTSETFNGKKGLKGNTEFQRISRNKEGGFWQVFQVNKWYLKKAKEAAEAAMAAIAGPIPVTRHH